MVKIPNLNKINNGKRIFYNPNTEQKKQYNEMKNELEKKYSIQLSNRDFIIKQLVSTLTHGDYTEYKIPDIGLVVIRSDIKNFYPSINKHELYKKLKKANIISQASFKILQPMFFSSSVIGVPLGLPFSSILSEIFLEQFDEDINYIFNPIFYFRYVDDIIIINYDKFNESFNSNINRNLSNIFKDNKLQINTEKTKIIVTNSEQLDFSYLGYHFKTIDKKLLISISEVKLKKITDSIKYCFQLYITSNKSMRQFWLLYYRLTNVMYGVTSTNKNNKKIKFGLGYSYRFINDDKQILELISIAKGLIHSCGLSSKKKSALFYILYFKDSSLSILKKRIDYTKLTLKQINKINYRLELTESDNNVSRIFSSLYKNTKLK